MRWRFAVIVFFLSPCVSAAITIEEYKDVSESMQIGIMAGISQTLGWQGHWAKNEQSEDAAVAKETIRLMEEAGVCIEERGVTPNMLKATFESYLVNSSKRHGVKPTFPLVGAVLLPLKRLCEIQEFSPVK